MTDPVIKSSIQIRDRLSTIADEFRSSSFQLEGARKELAEMDAATCSQACEMLAKLGTEVTRLRLCIGHFRYGHMSRAELINIPETWNGDHQ